MRLLERLLLVKKSRISSVCNNSFSIPSYHHYSSSSSPKLPNNNNFNVAERLLNEQEFRELFVSIVQRGQELKATPSVGVRPWNQPYTTALKIKWSLKFFEALEHEISLIPFAQSKERDEKMILLFRLLLTFYQRERGNLQMLEKWQPFLVRSLAALMDRDRWKNRLLLRGILKKHVESPTIISLIDESSQLGNL